jgi:hypothetical protein
MSFKRKWSVDGSNNNAFSNEKAPPRWKPGETRELVLKIRIEGLKKAGSRRPDPENRCMEFGAEGGTRTPTGFPTTPSRWRVCQFHHFGMGGILSPDETERIATALNHSRSVRTSFLREVWPRAGGPSSPQAWQAFSQVPRLSGPSPVRWRHPEVLSEHWVAPASVWPRFPAGCA